MLVKLQWPELSVGDDDVTRAHNDKVTRDQCAGDQLVIVTPAGTQASVLIID